MAATAQLRIGELARRTGVTVELLRAWEKRYGLLRPSRTEGGYRLYSDDDEERVHLMRRGLEAGLAAAEAANAALASPVTAADVDLAGAAGALRSSLETFDDSGAHAAFDRLLAAFTFETIASDVILPFLRELGDRWARGEVSVAQEHFASNLLRGRLLSLARGWDRGVGPRAVLACAPGERHEIALIVFGIALRDEGWRITYLGADTPVGSLSPEGAAAIVVAATSQARLKAVATELAQLARKVDVAIAGAGASATLAKRLGVRLLPPDPFHAASELAAG
jgi:methanogenic corrinoid protein MtbC1